MKTFRLDCECELFVDEGALKGTDLGPRTGVAMRFGCVLVVYTDSPLSTHEGLWTTPPPFFSIYCTRWLCPLMFSCSLFRVTQPSRPIPFRPPFPTPFPSVSLFYLSVPVSAFPPSPLQLSSLPYSSILLYSSLFSSCLSPSWC
jgi:hypothetical protein